MDESLDAYISKANFKVKVGNSGVKTNPTGFQGKRKFTQGFQGNRVTDVSITVPAVKKVPGRLNMTNQVRDAREKLLVKNKPKDARDRLNQKSQGLNLKSQTQGQTNDARQKLLNIRAQKAPLDARAKIQAKKQQQHKQQAGAHAQAGNFSLTRTVSNNNPFQPAATNSGDFHITKTVHNPHQSPEIPKIQVANDQYRPPQTQMYPPYMAPPAQHQYAPPPQPAYGYAPPPPAAPQQPVYYQPPYPTQHDPYMQRTLPGPQHSSESFIKTITNDAAVAPSPPRKRAAPPSPIKRNYSGEPLTLTSGSGPLRSSNKNYVPVIAPSDADDIPKKKFAKITGPNEPIQKRLKEETVEAEDEDVNVISPLQGYKIVITNLAASVNQEDIIELFGAIGPVKSVKLIKPGLSEVVYVKKDDAVKATNFYHERELDGQPMVVKVVTNMSAKIKEAPQKLPPTAKPLAAEPLKFSKKTPASPGSKVAEKKSVEVSTLHKALFKTGASGPTKPVTFTVNI